MQTNKIKVIPELVVTATITGGIAIVSTAIVIFVRIQLVSLIGIVCSLLVIIYRYECLLGDDTGITDGWQFFWNMIFRVYILDEQCTYSVDVPDITQSESVFVLAILTLCFSAIYFFAAVTIIAVVRSESTHLIDIVTYIFIGSSLAALVVDLTLGAHFGMDLQYMKPADSAEVSELGMVRVGALILMSFSLKGYITHVINVVLLILLIVYLVENRNQAKEHEHSIHKLGVLNGFDAPKPVRQENPWHQHRNDMLSGYPRSSTNPVFNHDEVAPPPQHRPRESPSSDYTNTPFRSDSWLKPSMNSNAAMGSRPFSYLEEPKRPMPVKPPVTPSSEPHWRRDAWSGPHLPDPDYSPPHARRLKSALKPAY